MGDRRARCGAAALVLVLAPAGADAVLSSAGATAETRVVALASPGTAQPVTFDAAAGDALIFSTTESLDPADQDTQVDVYRWEGGALTLMTPGTQQDVTFDAVSSDGAVVIATSNELLGGDDAGTDADVFRFTPNSGAVLMSPGPYPGDVTFDAAAPDAGTVVFETAARLGPGDDDDAVDVYRTAFDGSWPGTSTVLTPGPDAVHYAGGSTGLDAVFVTTDGALLPEDHNATTDVYVVAPWAGLSEMALVSNGTGGPDTFEGTFDTGTTAYWSTADDTAGVDQDGATDLYRWQGAPASKLISDVPGGDHASSVVYDAAAGPRVYFSTSDPVVAGDTDSATDVYRFDEGPTSAEGDDSMALMSGGSSTGGPATFVAAAADGSAVDFLTAEALTGPDTDTGVDLYRSTGPATTDLTLLSGNGPGDVTSSPRGSATGTSYFTTPDALAAGDSDTALDVYAGDGTAIDLVSPGVADLDATYLAGSGSTVWFHTAESLVAADGDGADDLYGSRPDTTPPTATLTARTQRNDGSIEVTVWCTGDEACRSSPRGRLIVPISSGRKTFDLRGPQVTVAAHDHGRLTVVESRKARRAAARALRAGRHVRARITVVVRDAAGNAATQAITVHLKR